ncbi:MAG: hypothetical protein WCB99_06050 [Candidatus Cybelea sp.]
MLRGQVYGSHLLIHTFIPTVNPRCGERTGTCTQITPLYYCYGSLE